ncbi:hypothetical protein NDU88_002097 [Pleurodeles waltl]|uniref:Galectin n=1 Tax=Pleurodeles waltl TaxID=8319 RepID=A0AAV7UC63_PLEWA|nr:hypothetical protein NDU88_002097 [Pleurodeles waltl]
MGLFSVNLQCDHDTAFHFNPRFSEGGVVVCNTKERQQWGKEERKHEMPFHKGQRFEIRILVNHHCYMVSVNGNHFLEYKHRIPLHRVNTLHINGNVELENVSFLGPGALLSVEKSLLMGGVKEIDLYDLRATKVKTLALIGNNSIRNSC